jgi:L-lactate dehydrogenase complex protein LldG
VARAPDGLLVTARDAILARLRTTGANTRLPRAEAGPLAPATVMSAAERLSRFRAEIEALGVSCSVETSAEAVRARVRELVGSSIVLSWDANELPYGVGDELRHAVNGRAPRDQQAAAAAGVTGCDGAIAETGSLVMLSRPGRTRVASLLPPFHIAVVCPDQLYATMGDFFAAREADVRAGASCTFITGPSRTADIELTLTLGIHGPGRVAVVIGPEADRT